jgi:hypothetical protein
VNVLQALVSVVALFDLTGNMVRPWAEAGHVCVCYDIQHPIRSDRVEAVGEKGRIIYKHWNAYSRTIDEMGYALAFLCAFPPCTDLSVSGARDFQKKGLRGFIDALEMVETARVICELSGAPYMIENPVSRISSAWRQPDHTFDPCDYGDPYTKKTCLWTGGGFIMPPKNRVEPTEGSKMHKMPPGPERANLRSATPMGFARAVYEANKPQ